MNRRAEETFLHPNRSHPSLNGHSYLGRQEPPSGHVTPGIPPDRYSPTDRSRYLCRFFGLGILVGVSFVAARVVFRDEKAFQPNPFTELAERALSFLRN